MAVYKIFYLFFLRKSGLNQDKKIEHPLAFNIHYLYILDPNYKNRKTTGHNIWKEGNLEFMRWILNELPMAHWV